MSVVRIDRVDAPDWMTEPFKATEEGFLRGRACVTNIGVFPYRFADGTIEWELRHPDDVFDQESMDSLKLKPVTNDHPPVMLTPDNVREYQVGNLGDNPYNGDNIHLAIDMVVQDKEAIDAIMAGKREISCGYVCDLEDTTGTWMGMQYTKRQRNIRYNHVAAVTKGRAGEAARFRLDSAGAIMISGEEVKNLDTSASADSNIPHKEERMANMRTIQLDSVDYEADEVVIKALKTAEAKIDSLQEDISQKQKDHSVILAERDTLKAKLDTAEQRVAELEKAQLDEAEIKKRVDARIALVAVAEKAKVEVKEDSSDLEIKKAVITTVFANANLDDKDEVYINAAFDFARVELEKKENKDAAADVREANASTTKVDSGISAKSAREAMIARLNKQGRE